MTAFGDELRRLRKRSGLSQETLATRAGLSPEAVSLLERGRRSPRMTTMRLLADALVLDPRTRQDLFDAQLADDPSPQVASSTSAAPPTAPRFLDPLIGREREVAELSGLLRGTGGRLVTLTGPGGVGKTRVAAEVARLIESEFADGARWVTMVSVTDPGALLPAVAGAMGIRLPDGGFTAALVDQLRDRRVLLVVDGAEHLLEAVRGLAVSLVTGAPQVAVLVTSSHRLLVTGETTLLLDPLAWPPARVTPAKLAESPAARLFLDRAGLRRDLEPAEARAVARICRRLDGLPLALELAAARTRALSVGDLATALDRTLGILGPAHPAGTDELTERVVGWSYRLLDDDQQQLLQRMATFAGFTHQTLAEVCAEEWTAVDVLDLMSALVAKSLVSRAAGPQDDARFGLLEVVRAFALDQLAPQDLAVARRRHADYFCALAVQAESALTGAEQGRWLTRLDQEVGNLRLAVGWLAEHDPASALRLTAALWRWCYLRGRYAEGRKWTALALQASGAAPPELRAPALAGAGMLAFLQCDYAEARTAIGQALDIYTDVDDAEQIAWCLTRLGSLARELGDYPRAEHLHRRALAIAEASGDAQAVGVELNYLSFVAWISDDLDRAEELGAAAMSHLRRGVDPEAMVWALVNAGSTARYRGDLPSAELLLRRALELSRSVDFREGVAWAQNQLGVLARLSGQHNAAVRLQQASLAEHERLGDRWRMASVLDELAAVSAARGEFRAAAADLGAAERLREEIGTPVPAAERADRDAVVELTRHALGPAYRATVLAGSLRTVISADPVGGAPMAEGDISTTPG